MSVSYNARVRRPGDGAVIAEFGANAVKCILEQSDGGFPPLDAPVRIPDLRRHAKDLDAECERLRRDAERTEGGMFEARDVGVFNELMAMADGLRERADACVTARNAVWELVGAVSCLAEDLCHPKEGEPGGVEMAYSKWSWTERGKDGREVRRYLWADDATVEFTCD